MLQSVKRLQTFTIMAVDGLIGRAETFYFDDERWAVRYLVVDTTRWRTGPKVLISPMSIRQIDFDAGTLLLSSTREQIQNSPPIDTQNPVSRQHEREYYRYYQYPYYWGDVGLWGPAPTPIELAKGPWPAGEEQLERSPDIAAGDDDLQLRSTRDAIGYQVEAADGDLGHVSDFLVDDQTWAIRYAVVDTSNWWLGKEVLIAAEWLDRVSWSDAKVVIDLDRQAVKEAPAYDPAVEIDRQWESDYFTHYQRHGYWQTSGMATPTLVRLKQHREFRVAAGDVDPRGWKVVSGSDGRIIGKVDDLFADPLTMKVRYLDVDLEGDLEIQRPDRGGHILLPVEYARLSEREDRVTAEGLSAEDIARVPPYTTSPIPAQYDRAFRSSLRELH